MASRGSAGCLYTWLHWLLQGAIAPSDASPNFLHDA
jgi:hypothetical protein